MSDQSSIQTNLANLLESISVNEGGTAAACALCNILGVNVPLDAGVEGVAGFFAKTLGLRSENSLVQNATYILTEGSHHIRKMVKKADNVRFGRPPGSRAISPWA